MTPFRALSEIASAGLLGDIAPDRFDGLARAAVGDVEATAASRGETLADPQGLMEGIFGVYAAQRYPAMVRDAVDDVARRGVVYDVRHLERMARETGMSDDDLGDALLARRCGDESPMNALRERFYFG